MEAQLAHSVEDFAAGLLIDQRVVIPEGRLLRKFGLRVC